jgi:4-hydroxybenzoate polyprenyltransferase
MSFQSQISLSDIYSTSVGYGLNSTSQIYLSDSYNLVPYTGYVGSFMSNIRLSDRYTTSQVYYINIYSYNVFYDTYKAIVVYENKTLKDIGALLLGISGGYIISKESKKKRKG